MEYNIENTYDIIRNQYPDITIDCLKVVKDVIQHRNFWKPDKVKTLLLAESHVYTPGEENQILLQYPHFIKEQGLPQDYVRLVYCLGYGEQDLAPSIADNPGTWQYWKIFAACASSGRDIDFSNVLKKGRINSRDRIINKLLLLEKLKSKGIWLVDCCIISLAGNVERRTSKEKRELIRLSWENYIKSLVKIVEPEKIIVIGNRVGRVVGEHLRAMNREFMILPQPQARLSAAEHRKILETYQEICNRS